MTGQFVKSSSHMTSALGAILLLAVGASSENCSFAVGEQTYNLEGLRHRVFEGLDITYAPEVGLIRIALCGALPYPCIDALTKMPLNGSVYKYFGHGAAGTHPAEWNCWDVLGKIKGMGGSVVTASALPAGSGSEGNDGVLLTFEHAGDAHLSCATITVAVAVRCDPTAATDRVVALQSGCKWDANVTTAASAVCAPARAVTASTPRSS